MYFIFVQNQVENSELVITDSIKEIVIVESEFSDEANEIAENIGLDFDRGRWERVQEHEALTEREFQNYIRDLYDISHIIYNSNGDIEYASDEDEIR